MTNNGISQQGEGCSARVFGALRQRPERWINTRLFPAACVTVRLDIHTEEGRPSQSCTIEVSNPHTREMEALITRPCEHYESPDDMTSRVLAELRAVLLELFDPDPF